MNAGCPGFRSIVARRKLGLDAEVGDNMVKAAMVAGPARLGGTLRFALRRARFPSIQAEEASRCCIRSMCGMG